MRHVARWGASCGAVGRGAPSAVATTLRTCAHVLPSQRVALADKMESLLLGSEVQEKSG
jgi:hypothetical protein